MEKRMIFQAGCVGDIVDRVCASSRNTAPPVLGLTPSYGMRRVFLRAAAFHNELYVLLFWG